MTNIQTYNKHVSVILFILFISEGSSKVGKTGSKNDSGNRNLYHQRIPEKSLVEIKVLNVL